MGGGRKDLSTPGAWVSPKFHPYFYSTKTMVTSISIQSPWGITHKFSSLSTILLRHIIGQNHLSESYSLEWVLLANVFIIKFSFIVWVFGVFVIFYKNWFCFLVRAIALPPLEAQFQKHCLTAYSTHSVQFSTRAICPIFLKHDLFLLDFIVI